MLQSMTGYGFGEAASETHQYVCEVRSLNTRYLETNVRMPRSFIGSESSIVGLAKEKLARGKVDFFIEIKPKGAASDLPNIQWDALAHYEKMLEELRERKGWQSTRDLSFTDLFRLDGVIEDTKGSANPQELVEVHEKHILAAAQTAVDQLIQTRQSEGMKLAKALTELLEEVASIRETILAKREEILGGLQASYQKKLENLVKTLTEQGVIGSTELDQDRLITEIAILVDKSDIEEELTRLEIHCNEFRELIGKGGAVGRRLDFLCQEMHRESNTIGNKLMSVSLHNLNLKQTIERIRQQVQNIE